jgi:hypothetical protein
MDTGTGGRQFAAAGGAWRLLNGRRRRGRLSSRWNCSCVEQSCLIAPTVPAFLALTSKQFELWTGDKPLDPIPHTIGFAAVLAPFLDYKALYVLGETRRIRISLLYPLSHYLELFSMRAQRLVGGQARTSRTNVRVCPVCPATRGLDEPDGQDTPRRGVLSCPGVHLWLRVIVAP